MGGVKTEFLPGDRVVTLGFPPGCEPSKDWSPEMIREDTEFFVGRAGTVIRGRSDDPFVYVRLDDDGSISGISVTENYSWHCDDLRKLTGLEMMLEMVDE